MKIVEVKVGRRNECSIVFLENKLGDERLGWNQGFKEDNQGNSEVKAGFKAKNVC